MQGRKRRREIEILNSSTTNPSRKENKKKYVYISESQRNEVKKIVLR